MMIYIVIVFLCLPFLGLMSTFLFLVFFDAYQTWAGAEKMRMYHEADDIMVFTSDKNDTSDKDSV